MAWTAASTSFRRVPTVASRGNVMEMETFALEGKGSVLASGRAVGARIATGRVRVVNDAHQLSSFRPGEVLVADTTTPDWEPVMKTAAAIVTNRGGRTCHAAIVARELGIPAVVGAERATSALSDGQTVTVSCAEGDTGKVYSGACRSLRSVSTSAGCRACKRVSWSTWAIPIWPSRPPGFQSMGSVGADGVHHSRVHQGSSDGATIRSMKTRRSATGSPA